MAFDPTVFVNVPPGQTPAEGTPKINATELNKIGNAVDDIDARVTTLEAGSGAGTSQARAFYFALINGG